MPKIRQRVDDQHEPLGRGEVIRAQGIPLAERAEAADEVLDGLHQILPSRLVARVLLIEWPADGEEDGGDDGRGAVCPLLT